MARRARQAQLDHPVGLAGHGGRDLVRPAGPSAMTDFSSPDARRDFPHEPNEPVGHLDHAALTPAPEPLDLETIERNFVHLDEHPRLLGHIVLAVQQRDALIAEVRRLRTELSGFRIGTFHDSMRMDPHVYGKMRIAELENELTEARMATQFADAATEMAHKERAEAEACVQRLAAALETCVSRDGGHWHDKERVEAALASIPAHLKPKEAK